MMESEILKFICANQGAVNTDDLLYNLCFGDSTYVWDIIYKQDIFTLCHPNGQPKVVVRTRLRLCRARDCQGSCRGLHLCKNFLFSGSCQYTRLRRGCNFSHNLESDHNNEILREHKLESLSREELCTLLLQSDNTLLPPICHDYNNGDGLYGRCLDGDSCKRVHICEKYLNGNCSCSKSHDFNEPQPLKSMQDKGVTDNLFRCLKTIYANKQALWYSGKKGDKGNKDNRQQQQKFDNSASAIDFDANSDDGVNVKQREWYGKNSVAARGRGGFRGNRGNRGNYQQQQQTRSTNDIPSGISSLSVDCICEPSDDNSKQQQHSSTSDISAAGNDSDASSNNGPNRRQAPNAFRGRGGSQGNRGNRGNRGYYRPLQQTCSTNDISAAVNAADGDGPNRRKGQRPVRDRCFKAHDKMPYRWEVREDDQWTTLPENEAIEKDYCEPKNTYSSSSSPPVHFDTMTRGSNKVRRLSTINSLKEPTFIHTTEWVWYWEDECGKWNPYASAIGGHRPADMDSAKLEETFLENDKDVVEFTAGSQSYSLSFHDMIQTNKAYGTKRLVRRRPRFVSAADVQARRERRPRGQQSFTAIPDHWDKTQIPQKGYTRVSLQHSSDEYKEIEALFCTTMRGFDIIKIERIQNRALWEVFQWQKGQMRNNSGRIVKEKKLFHGTDTKYVDAICLSNFDWRICGTHGTAFGKGSYFARDAKYSHSYTSDSDVKSMFISRVLVGDFTRGSSDYRRPPSKDGGDINFFDSCVDDIMNPSIFVVFEKHQIYPEYLLQYKHPHAHLYGLTPAPAPAPAPKPRPVPAPRPAPPPSAPVYQPSTPSYPNRASSFQTTHQTFAPSSPTPPKKPDSCVIA
ncbi:hypothetical protein PAMP_014880 [Pampus punctatissimus]